MTLNKRQLRKMLEGMRVNYSKEQERKILERFCEEPWPYEWSDWDICVQVSNFLGCGEFAKSTGCTDENVDFLFDGEPF
jgi:hypothetical protein